MASMEHMGNLAPDPTIRAQAMLLPKHPDWIAAHAGEFREYLDEHPQFTERLKEDPEGTVEKIEKIFYH